MRNGLPKRNYSAMPDERFFCMSCQLERPVSMRIKVMRRTKGGGLVPQYRCERCYYRQRPIGGKKDATA